MKTVLGSLVTDTTSQLEMRVMDRMPDKKIQKGSGRLVSGLFLSFILHPFIANKSFFCPTSKFL